MPELSASYIWVIAVGLGIGTWIIRFSFLGVIGDRPLPVYFRQMLNYTSVAVLPGVAAPLVLNGVEGSIEPLRILAAILIVVVGLVTKNMMKALFSGLLFYFVGNWILGSLTAI